MAVRQSRQSPVNGIAMGDLPEGTTTVEFTKRHQPEPRNDAPSLDEASTFPWSITKMENGVTGFVALHHCRPAPHDIAAHYVPQYGPGMYSMVPIDPQTQAEIPALRESVRMMAQLGVSPTQPSHAAPAPAFDAQWALMEQQRIDAKEAVQKLEFERQRLDAEERQRRADDERRREDERRADRERTDGYIKMGVGLVGTLIAGIPAAVAAVKPMLTPPPAPPSADSKAVDALAEQIRVMQAKLDKTSEKEPDEMEKLTKALFKLQIQKAFVGELRDLNQTDEDDSTMGVIKEGFGMFKEALPMLGSLRGGGSSQPESYAFASPQALAQTVMRDPATAQATLRELSKQDPAMARQVIDILQAGLPREIEAEEDDAPVPIGKRRQA